MNPRWLFYASGGVFGVVLGHWHKIDSAAFWCILGAYALVLFVDGATEDYR